MVPDESKQERSREQEQLQKLKEQNEREDRQIAWWLLRAEDELLAALQQEREELEERAYSSSNSITLMGGKDRGGYVEDGKGRSVSVSDRVQRAQAWQDMVRFIEKQLPLEKRKFLEIRRRYKDRVFAGRGRPGWMVAVQRELAEELAEETGMSEGSLFRSEGTLHSWWKWIVNATVREAIRRGLIR